MATSKKAQKGAMLKQAPKTTLDPSKAGNAPAPLPLGI